MTYWVQWGSIHPRLFGELGIHGFVYLQNTAQIIGAHSIVYLRGWRTRGKQVLSANTRIVHRNETAVTLLKTVKLCAAVRFGDSQIQKVQKEVMLDF